MKKKQLLPLSKNIKTEPLKTPKNKFKVTKFWLFQSRNSKIIAKKLLSFSQSFSIFLMTKQINIKVIISPSICYRSLYPHKSKESKSNCTQIIVSHKKSQLINCSSDQFFGSPMKIIDYKSSRKLMKRKQLRVVWYLW